MTPRFDPNKNVPSPATPRNLPDEEKAEALLRERPLLYVASNQARDALVVTWGGTGTDLLGSRGMPSVRTVTCVAW